MAEAFAYGLDKVAKHKALARKDVTEFNGRWAEIKELCDDEDPILKNSGVSWVKRVAMKTSVTQHEIKVEDADGTSPKIHIKAFFPLGVTKESNVQTDGEEFEQDDSKDTCLWKTRAGWVDGWLVQKRLGSKGEMWDVRAILDAHPDGKTDEKPVMYYLWTLIDVKGNTHNAEHWLRKM